MINRTTLDAALASIAPSDAAAKAEAKRRWDSIAKPLNGMGMLEEYIIKVAGIAGDAGKTDISKKCVAVMCADNGVVEEGVTQTGSEVTAIVAKNIANGHASVANMARLAKADVFAYDVGILTDVEGIRRRKVANGTENFAKTYAMRREQAVAAIENGIDIVRELKADGYNLIASGEMGIGNTTTSSAITAALFGVPATEVTGKGAGLSPEGVRHKAEVIRRAIELHKPDRSDPVDVLSKVGGYDIAAMCGLFLGGALYKVPVIIDGLISSVSALLAVRLCPAAKDYMLASHMSAEPAAKMILDALGLPAPLNCGMALGEGTGAVSLMPLLDMAVAVYTNMPTFGDISVEAYKPL